MKLLYSIFFILFMLVACGPSPNQGVIDPTQPGVQQQAPTIGSGTAAIMGGLAGYMLGRHASRPPVYSAPQIVHAPAPTIIQHKTVIVNKHYNAPRPSYRPSYRPSRRR